MKSYEIPKNLDSLESSEHIHTSNRSEYERTGPEVVNDAMNEIYSVQRRMASELGLSEQSEEVTAMTDDFLVDRARLDITPDAVRDVVVEGVLQAVEEKPTPFGRNPLTTLDAYGGNAEAAITSVVEELRSLHATLPNHPEEIAQIVAEVLNDVHKDAIMSGEHAVEYVPRRAPEDGINAEVQSGQEEVPLEDRLSRAESEAWLQERGLDDVRGFSNKLADLLKELDTMPQLDSDVSRRLLQETLQSEGRGDFSLILTRCSEHAADNELMELAYDHPDALSRLVVDHPELVRFMAEHTVVTDTLKKSLLDLYDEEPNDEVRSSIAHHSEVMADPDAEAWARNTSMALLRLGAFRAGFGGVTQGDIAHYSPFRPSDNIITNLTIPSVSILPHVRAEDANVSGKTITAMNLEERAMVVGESFLREHPNLEDIDVISLPDLSPAYQELVVANALIEARRETMNSAMQERATERNTQIAETGVFLREDDLVHTTSTDALDSVLQNGLVCGELIGEASINDAYPLNVDFNRVEADDARQATFDKAIEAATAGRHGDIAAPKQLTLIVSKQHAFTERQANMHNDYHKHRLAFGAVAATEMSGIVLNDSQTAESKAVQAQVLRSILAQNTYYPVLSRSGELMLSPEEFTSKKSTYLDQLEIAGYTPKIPEMKTDEEGELAPVRFDIPDIGAF